MGVLKDANGQALCFWDDTPTGYVYADPGHQNKLCYYCKDSIYKENVIAPEQIASFKLWGHTVHVNGSELHVVDGEVYRVSQPFDETLGSYTGELYGAAAAAAVIFLGAGSGSAAQNATAERYGSEPEEKSGCGYAIGTFFGKILAFVFTDLSFFLLLAFFLLTEFRVDEVEVMTLIISVLYVIPPYILLKQRKASKIIRAVFGVLLGSMVIFIYDGSIQFYKPPGSITELFLTMIPLAVFYIIEIVTRRKNKKKKQNTRPQS